MGIFGTRLYACAQLCVLVCILQTAQSQRHPETRLGVNQRGTGTLRQTIQWAHNGKVFSLLTQGSEYQPPRQRGANKDQAESRPVTIISDGDATEGARTPSVSSRQPPPGASTQTGGAGARTGGPRWLPPQVQRRSRGHVHQDVHPSSQAETKANATKNETQDRPSVSPSQPREDVMAGDDPYNPYKSTDPDNPYYNHYDTYERPRSRQRPGYGTRYHQYGKNMEYLTINGRVTL